MKINIILGSSSERRKMIFSLLFNNYEVIEPNCQEKIYSSSRKTVLENARCKMISILESENYLKKYNYENSDYSNLIVTADTIVEKGKKIFPKPSSKEEAFYMLKELNGKKHSVFSGIYICFNKNFYYFYEKTDVYFNFLSDNLLKKYIDTLEPLDAAGSYKIQGNGVILIKKLKGSITNVVGFPVEKFLKYYNRFICYSKEEVSIVSTTY